MPDAGADGEARMLRHPNNGRRMTDADVEDDYPRCGVIPIEMTDANANYDTDAGGAVPATCRCVI